MKTGLIIYGSLETISGGYLYDRMLVAHLRECGDEVEVVSLPWGGYGRHLTHNLSTTLYHRLAAANYDLLLQDELNHPSLFWLNRRLKKRVGYPLISIVHHLRQSEEHPTVLQWIYRWIERRYLLSVDGFIYNSQTTRQMVESLVGARPFIIAYPGGDRLQPDISAVELHGRAHTSGPLNILFVGNVIPRKGLHLLIEALAQLPGKEWRLTVVGSTAVDPSYTRRIKAIMPPTVKLCGALPDLILKTLMQTHQVLAVPSQYEGFGIVYLEGMGFGLPAIGSVNGAACESIEDGVNGYLVDGQDSAVLAQRLHHLHQDRAALAAMSLAARQRFLAHPTWAESMAGVRGFLIDRVIR